MGDCPALDDRTVTIRPDALTRIPTCIAAAVGLATVRVIRIPLCGGLVNKLGMDAVVRLLPMQD